MQCCNIQEALLRNSFPGVKFGHENAPHRAFCGQEVYTNSSESKGRGFDTLLGDILSVTPN